MKEKILAALKVKYGNMGYSAEFFDGLASDLASTITEEAQIDTQVAGLESVMKHNQKHRDGLIQKLKDDQKKGADPKPNDPDPKPDPKPAEGGSTDPEVIKLLKQLADKQEKLDNELTSIRSGNIAKTRQQMLEAKLEKAPASFKTLILEDYPLMSFADDAAFEAYLTKTEARAKEAIQAEANDGLRGSGRPFSSSGSNTKQISEAEADKLLDKIL